MSPIGVYQLSDLILSGPDPWAVGANADKSAPGATTFTLKAGAEPIIVELADGDTEFGDGDRSQDLVGTSTINGTTYTDGQNFENEYSYEIRPVGSTDPAEVITVYSIDEGGNSPSFGIATTGPLIEGVVYEIVAIDSNQPSVAYSDLYVCFGKGTCIGTPNGPRPIEEIKIGGFVTTLDNGDQPVLWVGGRKVVFNDDSKGRHPILFRQDALRQGLPSRDLVVSPQHRVMIELQENCDQARAGQWLAPANGFLTHKRVRSKHGCRAVTYYNLLLPSHGIIFAEGVPVESLYPAEYALSLLTMVQRLQIHAALPTLTRDVEASYGQFARPVLRVQQTRELVRNGFHYRLSADKCRRLQSTN